MRAAAEQELVQHTLLKRVMELEGSAALQLIQAASAAPAALGPAVVMGGHAVTTPPPPVGQQLDVTL